MNPEGGEKREPDCPFTSMGIPQQNRMNPGALAGVAWVARPCNATCALYDVARGLPCVPSAVATLADALSGRRPLPTVPPDAERRIRQDEAERIVGAVLP